MSTPGEPHVLPPVIPRTPILQVPFDPRAVDAPREEPSIDVKGYLNTL